jgi:ribosomal protein S18 acetylase RimI-like enzyme
MATTGPKLISTGGQQGGRSWRIALQRLVFARTSLEAQLYPPLTTKVVFRVYEHRDFDACLAIYRKNAPGRFPAGNEPDFTEYLKKDTKAFIVAEFESRVVGYGGINLIAPNIATLCYGIIDPEFQRQRIGSALILLRIAQVSAGPGGAFFLIFAVDASMPIYRRFGFIEKSRWKAEDGNNYPLALLRVPPTALDRVKTALNRRGVRVEGNLTMHQSEELSCEIQSGASGSYRIQLRSRLDKGKPTEPSHQ